MAKNYGRGAGTRLQVRGRASTIKELQKADELTDGLIKRTIYETAKVVKRRAQQLAPLGETGKLRRGIKRRSVRRGYTAVVSSTAERKGGEQYGRFVEYGTKKTEAQPSLNPAAEEQRSPFIEGLRRALEKGTAHVR